MSCIVQYIPLIGKPAIIDQIGISENFSLLRKRLVVTAIASAALCLIAAWVKASLLPLFVPLILGGALVVTYMDRRQATEAADRNAAELSALLSPLEKHESFNPYEDQFELAIKRVHSRVEAARIFIESRKVKAAREANSFDNNPMHNKAYSEAVLSCQANIESFKLLLDAGFILTAKCLQEALDKAEENPRYLEIIHSALRENKLGLVGMMGWLCFDPDEKVSFWMKSSSPKALQFLNKTGLSIMVCQDLEEYTPLMKLLQESAQPNCQVERIKGRIAMFIECGANIFKTVNLITREDLLTKSHPSIRQDLQSKRDNFTTTVKPRLEEFRKRWNNDLDFDDYTEFKNLKSLVENLAKESYAPRDFIVALNKLREPGPIDLDQLFEQTVGPGF